MEWKPGEIISGIKKIIVGLVRKGVTTFDTNKVTCLAPD